MRGIKRNINHSYELVKMSRRVVLLGLDGATFDVVNPLVEKGVLPNFKKLLEHGAYGVLDSCIPPNTDPAWPAFFTGLNPGKLGFLFYMQDIGDNYYRERLFRGPIKQDLFTYASDNGKKVVAFNIPVSFPPKEVNGVYVTGLLTPPGTEFTYPREIKNRLGQDYRFGIPDFKFLSEDEKVRELEKEINSKFDLALEFYREYNPDLFTLVVMETDLVHHFFWKYMDEKHPWYKESKYKGVIARIYGLIDKRLGELMGMIGKDTMLIVMSDHGTSGSYLDFNINRYLINHDWMRLKMSRKKRALIALYRMFGLKKSWVRSFLKSLIAKERGKTRKLSDSLQPGFRDIDWEKSRVFGLGSYGLYINLKGREKEGAVSPEEYEDVRNELIKMLKELTYPGTGKKVTNRVYKKEEVYHGSQMDKMPDVIYIANKDFLVRDFFVDDEFNDSEFCAAHNAEGIYIVHGKDIKPGKKDNAWLLDIMPTILFILGCRIPKEADGRVLKDLFLRGSELANRKVEVQNEDEKRARDERARINDLVKEIKL
ncbi:MAG TPA: alkaline phosphatase family protein [Candidatus Nanoarchaeia archaeon]|nr:alkaline phosphatase family protein [Candidatus Nanoarchaeia archaeon]